MRHHHTKKLIIIFVAFLASCGVKTSTDSSIQLPCANSFLVGTWTKTDDPSKKLILNSDCSGVSNLCDYSLTFTKADETKAFMSTKLIVLKSNNGPNCLFAGEYTCGVSKGQTSGSPSYPQFAIACGAAAPITFTKF